MVVEDSVAPGSASNAFGSNAGELCALRSKQHVQQTWPDWALFKCGVFYLCVFTCYLHFTVGFSLYTENKVIVFLPFINVCRCISVSVFYGQTTVEGVQF